MINRYSDFLFEQTGSKTFKDQILEALEPTILQICERMKRNMIEAYAKKGIDYKWSAFDEEMTRLMVIIDLLKSFQKYTKPTDALVSVVPSEGAKGIEINAKIERDGQTYDYYTYAIYAGGYNIQREHLRYLTKTKLPSVNSDLSSQYINRVKSLKKAEKIQEQIKEEQARINYFAKRVNDLGSLTDEQWAEKLKSQHHWAWNITPWKDVDKKHNFNNSEDEYNAFNLENQMEQIRRERVYISREVDLLKSAHKRMEKLEAKLEIETRNS